MKKLIALLVWCLPSIHLPFAVFAQWVDAYIPDFKVNDDNLSSYQTSSSIGVDGQGNFVVTWFDARGNPGSQTPGRLYCQRYDLHGVPLGNNFTIGHDSSGGKVTVMQDGRFAAVWVRYFRIGSSTMFEYYFQRFDSQGSPLGIPNKIIDSTFTQSDGGNSGVSIDCNFNGYFAITFAISRVIDSAKVYLQRYDSSGNKAGPLQRVNDAFSNVEIPSISMNNDGSLIIAWQDDRNRFNKFDIFMQRFNANGTKAGNNVKVNNDPDSYKDQFICGVSSDRTGYSVIAWLDYRFEPNIAMFYQIYDQNGTPVGENRRGDLCSTPYSVGEGQVTMREDRKFFISWVDQSYASKKQIYGRRFEPNGEPIGEPYMIPSSSPGTSIQFESDNYVLGDRVYVTWTDNRNGGGPLNYDIYCNVRGFQNPDTVIGIVNNSNTPGNFKLYDPYPNPFNPVTRIKYNIPGKAGTKVKISLILFDILGRVVSTLADKEADPGTYESSFNGSNLSSGIYIVVLKSDPGYRDFKKVILLK